MFIFITDFLSHYNLLIFGSKYCYLFLNFVQKNLLKLNFEVYSIKLVGIYIFTIHLTARVTNDKINKIQPVSHFNIDIIDI